MSVCACICVNECVYINKQNCQSYRSIYIIICVHF